MKTIFNILVFQVMTDITFYALRQVLRDLGKDVSDLRVGSYNVYFKIRGVYYTFCLRLNIDKTHTFYYTGQNSFGDILIEDDFEFAQNETVSDLLDALRVLIKELYNRQWVITVVGGRQGPLPFLIIYIFTTAVGAQKQEPKARNIEQGNVEPLKRIEKWRNERWADTKSKRDPHRFCISRLSQTVSYKKFFF